MVDYRDYLKYSKPTPRAESQRNYEAGWDRVFKRRKKPIYEETMPADEPLFGLNRDKNCELKAIADRIHAQLYPETDETDT